MGNRARTKSAKAENAEQLGDMLELIHDGCEYLPAEPMEKYERTLGDQHFALGSGFQLADGGSH